MYIYKYIHTCVKQVQNYKLFMKYETIFEEYGHSSQFNV